jgi:CDP-paratose synthetase
MAIILTGASGFLGSHLLRQFVGLGYQIVILKRTSSDLWRIRDCLEYTDQVQVTNCDTEPLAKAFDIFEPLEAVIHAATTYKTADGGYVPILESNLVFPLKLLDILKNRKLTNTLFINTDTFFAKHLNYEYLSSYSLSKAHFSRWGEIFAKDTGIRFINMILEHVYGSYDADSKFVSYVLKNCIENMPELDLTLGQQQRDFIYIKDVVTAYQTVLLHADRHLSPVCEYSVGTGSAISIREFVETLKALTHADTRLNFGTLPYRDNEIMHSCADNSALLNLGWKPQYNVKNGLLDMINTEYQ